MPNQAYRLPFAAIGEDVFVWEQAKILGAEKITLGNSVIVDDFVFIMAGSRTQIGSFVHIALYTSIAGGGEFIIEDFAGISGGVRIYTGNDDYLGGCLTGPTVPAPYRIAQRSFVHIGRHCIIGANSVVLPGVTIGEGAVVGACSLVRNDLEPWTVNVGTPAKPVRERRRDRIAELEAQLRQDLYDAAGNYIPRTDARQR